MNQHTWTGGWGNVTYWNAYVANLELNGRGNFLDARLDDVKQYPVAAKAKLGHKRNTPDMVSNDQFLELRLTDAEKRDLIEYLKSL